MTFTFQDFRKINEQLTQYSKFITPLNLQKTYHKWDKGIKVDCLIFQDPAYFLNITYISKDLTILFVC